MSCSINELRNTHKLVTSEYKILVQHKVVDMLVKEFAICLVVGLLMFLTQLVLAMSQQLTCSVVTIAKARNIRPAL